MVRLQNISGENEKIEIGKNQLAANERSRYASQARDERGCAELKEKGQKCAKMCKKCAEMCKKRKENGQKAAKEKKLTPIFLTCVGNISAPYCQTCI